MLAGSLTPLDADLMGRYDPARVERHVTALAGSTPTSAIEYLLAGLHDCNVSAVQHPVDVTVSGAGDVYFSLAGRDAPVAAVALPFSGATPPEGLVAPLQVGFADVAQHGAAVLLTSRPAASDLHEATTRGAAALIYIAGDVANAATALEAPTPSGSASLPAIAIGQAAGDGYVTLAESGPVTVRLRVAMMARVERLATLVAAVPGLDGGSHYIVAGAPIVTGNGERGGLGAAILLECCRALASVRARLQRGARLLWWPGGEVAGAAAGAYVQHAWSELVAHAGIFIDFATGQPGDATWAGHPQLRWLAESTWRDSGIERISWHMPPRTPAAAPFAAAGIPTLAVNPEATPPTSLLLLLGRLCSYPLLPIDHVAAARMFEAEVLDRAAPLADEIDLAPLRVAASAWRAAAERCQLVALHAAQGDASNLEEGLALLNALTDRVNRLLIPGHYRAGDRYQVSALGADLLPGLAPTSLTSGARRSHLETSDRPARYHRERNRLADAFREACRVTTEALEALERLGMT